jgi:hypothetical protein
MAMTKRGVVAEISQALAGSLSAEPQVRGVWIEDKDDKVDVWVLTEPVEIEYERHLHAIGVDIRRRLAAHGTMFHIINPNDWEPTVKLVGDVIPESAEPVSIRSV